MALGMMIDQATQMLEDIKSNKITPSRELYPSNSPKSDPKNKSLRLNTTFSKAQQLLNKINDGEQISTEEFASIESIYTILGDNFYDCAAILYDNPVDQLTTYVLGLVEKISQTPDEYHPEIHAYAKELIKKIAQINILY